MKGKMRRLKMIEGRIPQPPPSTEQRIALAVWDAMREDNARNNPEIHYAERPTQEELAPLLELARKKMEEEVAEDDE